MARSPSLTDPSLPPERKWRKGIDIYKSTEKELVEYTKWRMRVYEEEDWRDESLSESFALDLENFDQEEFKACGLHTTRHLRDLLRLRRV
jgi:hypothetical protein